MIRRIGNAILVLLLLITFSCHLSMSRSEALVRWYSERIFHPFQSFRQYAFGYIDFSIGDVFYIATGFSLLIGAAKLLVYIFQYNAKRKELYLLLRRTTVAAIWFYILFVVGWAGNYYKPAIVEHWGVSLDGAAKKEVLYELDSFLVDKLNVYAVGVAAADHGHLSRRAKDYYKIYTTSELTKRGMVAKPSLFKERMHYFGIQGYYNPFTGEAQINGELPKFMQPFVIAHEMAHQTGIAKEGDANLMAYALSTKTSDTAFRYSAYFNMWLYAHSRLFRIDSVAAIEMKEELNPLTLRHIDTLRQIRDKYRSKVRNYSSDMYDQYLKILDQKDGIRSYYRVVVSAWAWEHAPEGIRRKKLDIP